MSDQQAESTDAGFPGPWTGYYAYRTHHNRHRMDLHLSFRCSHLSGDGVDDVGGFTVSGGYEPDTRACWWTKTYPASHNVYYKGAQRGRTIAGNWEITHYGRAMLSGSFCIWPKAYGELTEEFFVESEAEPEVIVEELPLFAGGPSE